MMGARTRQRLSHGFGGSVIAAILAVQFLPIALIVLFSFHASPRLSFPLEGASLRWYAAAFAQPGFRDALSNTLIAALVTALVSSVAGFLAAFCLRSQPTVTQHSVDSVMGMPNITPPLLVGVGLSCLLQLVDFKRGLGSIIAGHIIVALPFVFLSIRAKVAAFDFGIIEAARDLGASPAKAFLQVTLPLMRAAMVSATLMAAALSMDEFIITAFVRGMDDTVPTLTFALLRRGVDPTINAMATMVLVGTSALACAALLISRSEP